MRCEEKSEALSTFNYLLIILALALKHHTVDAGGRYLALVHFEPNQIAQRLRYHRPGRRR